MFVKDKIALGTIVGIVATVPQIIINVLAVQIGLSQHYAFQYAASIYVY
jgi:hypothetical protein